ncbi:MAG: hypothetical protein M5U28_04285 [Sandaracinaceae bacterium]|nr:hypothetical protein [Sandaracinaceae bacterium]
MPGSPNAPRGLERPFHRMSSPHGDVANDGFLRPNSVLAIIPLTDEEDCSAHDPELFNSASPTYSGDLNLRCYAYGATALHPIDRYVEGLLQLREDERLLVFAPIAGIPVDLAPPPGRSVTGADFGAAATSGCARSSTRTRATRSSRRATSPGAAPPSRRSACSGWPSSSRRAAPA